MNDDQTSVHVIFGHRQRLNEIEPYENGGTDLNKRPFGGVCWLVFITTISHQVHWLSFVELTRTVFYDRSCYSLIVQWSYRYHSSYHYYFISLGFSHIFITKKWSPIPTISLVLFRSACSSMCFLIDTQSFRIAHSSAIDPLLLVAGTNFLFCLYFFFFC